MVGPKPSNSVTLESYRGLKDKVARKEGREMSGTQSNDNNLPRTHKRFSKISQMFSGNVFV